MKIGIGGLSAWYRVDVQLTCNGFCDGVPSDWAINVAKIDMSIVLYMFMRT